MKFNTVYLVLILLFSLSVSSQAVKITGKVTDGKSGLPLPGVSISLVGAKAGTSTDFDGGYSINASVGQSLMFSFIGYKTSRVVLQSGTANVKLFEDTEGLKEIVIGAFGLKRNKATLGYASQTISGQEIADTQRPNFINGLQGRVAGLQVTSTSGAPGASAAIQLRGVNSLSGNNSPLFIVDGLPISNETFNQGSLLSDGNNRSQDYTNRAADINPDDIESYTVLKGPEAAALYGVEASGGAIVITTKKGKNGKSAITYSNNTRIEEVYMFPKTQTKYQQGIEGINNPNFRRHFGTPYDKGTQLFDNVGNFFQAGILQQHNLTFDGGNDNGTYRLSIANLAQVGVVPNSDYNRFNASLNGTYKISSKLRSEALFQYTKSTNRKASKGQGGFLLTLLAWPASLDVRNYANIDGSRKLITDGSDGDIEEDNPLWDVNKNLNEDITNRFITNLGMIYDPFSWLNFTARVGFDVTATQGFASVHPESRFGIGRVGFIESYLNNVSNTNSIASMTARKSIGKFNSRITLGNTVDDRYTRIFSSSGSRFSDPNFNSINNTNQTTQRSQERIIQKRLIGFFSDATFDYNKILNIGLTARKDWSSALQADRNSFVSYSTQASFVFTEFEALKDGKILSFGKLRGTRAVTAKDPAAYAIDPVFQPALTTGGGYAYGVTGGNLDLKPEFLRSTEIGFELQFFNNRFGIDASVYRARTDDALIRNMRRSYGTGFIVSNLNFGSLMNEGLEIVLTGQPIKSQNFSWNTVVNFTKTDSRMISLPENFQEYYISDTWLVPNANLRGGTLVGAPLTAFTGWTNLRNNAGDILINPVSGAPLTDQSFPIVGDRNPDFIIGHINTFTYKNFSVTSNLEIRKGGDIFNGNEFYLYNQGLSNRTLDRETPRIVQGVIRDGLENTANPTQNNIVITPFYQNNYYRFDLVESDFIEKDINWLRLRDITFSYRLSNELLAKTKFFRSVQFNFTMTDLFIITNYSGADPAVNGLNASVGGAGGVGFDYGALSTPRAFNLGIRIGI